jgi:tetratricopeptide (TPR) repeat protein
MNVIEITWNGLDTQQITGALAEAMNEPDRAIAAYESALRHNSFSVPALTQIAALCRGREQYARAVDYFQRILNIDQYNGEIWGALGHCCLMMDDLQKAYHAYQQALNYLPNPKVGFILPISLVFLWILV